MDTKAEATVAGKTLLRQLKGKGWKLDVWENLGWHYRARNGALTVWPYAHRGLIYYDCLFSLIHPGSGDGRYMERGRRHLEPDKAVKAQLACIRASLKQQKAEIVETEVALLKLEAPYASKPPARLRKKTRPCPPTLTSR